MDNGQLKIDNTRLPKGWEIKNIGDVLKLEYGKPLDKSKRKLDGQYPVYGANGEKSRTNEIYYDKQSIIVGRKGSAGEVNLTETKFWPLDVTYFVTFDEKKFDLFFLFHLLSKSNLPTLAKGVKPGINRNDVYSISVNTPPLPEQKRIVKILDKAFTAIAIAKANAEKNLHNAKELFESYLNGIFVNGQLKIDNGEWEEKKLGEVCGFVRGPFGGSLKKAIFKPSGYAVYEQQHAIYNQFHKIRYFIDEKKFIEMKRFELNSGDLIMSCSGTMGKVAIVPKRIEKGIINQALLKLSPKNKLHVEYLKIWMGSNDFQNQITKHSQGAAIKNVASVKILKEIELPIPQMTEQNQIVKKLDAIQTETKLLEKIYQQKIADVEELKKSILQKAFEGEL